MKNAIKLLTAVIFLSSCSASWHIRRAMHKDPSLFDTDTTVTIDSIPRVVPEVSTGFIKPPAGRQVKIVLPTDTITNEVVKIEYLERNDSIFIKADCPDYTEIVRTETITETITIKPTIWQQMKYALILLGGVAIIILLISIFKPSQPSNF